MTSIGAAVLAAVLAVTSFAIHLSSEQTKHKPDVAIALDVMLAEVPVIAFDAHGSPAVDLTKDDFHVTEDGIEQRLLFCERERQPVSFVILDDISQSMTNKIGFVRDATASILEPITPADRYE